ncbi:uncharacterized protein [Prorops nasuta]|uniref:uncharacterized protein n=1 Tax=Prorops nasuta TaxID=863751 RepID=UPI0034CF192F
MEAEQEFSIWETDPALKDWLQPHASNKKALCSMCESSISAHNHTLRKHTRSKKHLDLMRRTSSINSLDTVETALEIQKKDVNVSKMLRLGRTKLTAMTGVIASSYNNKLCITLQKRKFSIMTDESTDVSNVKSEKVIIPLLYNQAAALFKDILICYMDNSYVLSTNVKDIDPDNELHFLPINEIYLGLKGVSGNSAHNVQAEAQITLHSLSRQGVSLDATALILPKITHYTPPTYSPSSFPALSEIDLADNFASTGAPIDVLLGADYYPTLVEGPVIHSSDHSLIAQRTMFGWIVSGVLPRAGRSHSLTVHHCFDIENTLRHFWELEEVPEVKPMSTEDSLCEQHFVDTVSRTYSGRFVVALPFRSDIEKHSLGSSSRVAEKTLSRILRRLENSPDQTESYSQFLQEYLMLGHMSPVPMNSDFRVFLPHHAVFKTEKQKTKIRVVFNAFSKTSTGVSLNDTLFIGSKLQQDITRILMNWRAFRYVGVTEIVKMFRQILVRLRTASIRTFYGRLIPDVLLNSTYVDDILFGAHDLKQLSSVREQLIALLAKKGFSLSKWAFNQQGTSPLEPTEPHSFFEDPAGSSKVLGIYWDHGDDSFRFRVSPSSIGVLTKRILLSENAKIFDPLGWISPIIITLKQLMQSTWLLKLAWDEEIPEPVQSKWFKSYEQLRDLQSLRIPRWTGQTPNIGERQLIGFCDASELAYGAVVYERLTDGNGHLSVHLVMSKTKVAPIKTTSIPRLELVAAALLVKLLVHVKESLVGNCDAIRCYSDSQVALAWIAKQPVHWKTFVANRVSYIQTHLPEASWHHVTNKLNPAELCSRGASAQQLSEDSLWWHGPAFLREPIVNPVQVFETMEESRKVALTAQLDTTQYKIEVRRLAVVIYFNSITLWIDELK